MTAPIASTLPLGEDWLGCVLVLAGGDVGALPAGREAEVEQKIETYVAEHPGAADGTVWFDTVSGTCFSAAQYRGGPDGKDYNFLSPADRFLDGPWGDRYVTGSIGFNETFQAQPQLRTDDCIRTASACEARVRGRRVLIVLGGPSTRRVDWERVDADTWWSCNKYYLHRTARSLDLSMVALAPDVPLEDNPELHAHLESHASTQVAFEIDRGGPVGAWRPVNDFVRRYPGRCSYFHLRYQSALGLGTRMLLLAVFMGAAEVLFVGMDGIGPNGPLHAFEPYKESPVWYSKFGPDLQRRQYVVFWEYVLALRARLGFRLANLGETRSVNLSRTISERHFPLPAEVRRRL